MTPIEQDNIAGLAAAALGCQKLSRRVIRITDRDAVLKAGYVKRAVDYARLRRSLEDGVTVPGCELTDKYDYVLQACFDEPTGEDE